MPLYDTRSERLTLYQKSALMRSFILQMYGFCPVIGFSPPHKDSEGG